MLLLVIPSTAMASADEARKFEAWKQGFVARWGKREVPARYIRAKLAPLAVDPKVIAIDGDQITSSTTLDYPTFMNTWVNSNPHRIAQGRSLLEKHRALLDRVEKRYGVDKEAIVALWGVETLYGTHKGDYGVLRSLATLAFEGRRRKFFEMQLFTAIKILRQGHVREDQFLGSWSGALGHSQFMPTSFEMLAVDFDGDGRKDIWNSLPDVFASIANFLRRARWQKGFSVGELAYAGTAGVPQEFDPDRPRTPEELNGLGFRNSKGAKLEGTWRRRAAPIPLQNSPFVLRGTNYMSIMRWNNSALFAAFTITLMDAFEEP